MLVAIELFSSLSMTCRSIENILFCISGHERKSVGGGLSFPLDSYNTIFRNLSIAQFLFTFSPCQIMQLSRERSEVETSRVDKSK